MPDSCERIRNGLEAKEKRTYIGLATDLQRTYNGLATDLHRTCLYSHPSVLKTIKRALSLTYSVLNSTLAVEEVNQSLCNAYTTGLGN